MKEIKLAFSTLGCPDYATRQIIDAAVHYGYKGVGIRTVSGTTDLASLPDFSEGGIRATADAFASAGIKVICMSSGVRFTSPDAAEQEKQARTARWYTDAAIRLSSPFVRIFAGPMGENEDPAETMNRMVEGFRSIADYAHPKGVTILIETHDTFSTGRSVGELITRINHPGVAVVWDTLHSLRGGETAEETWKLIGPMVRNVHVKDSAHFDTKSFDFVLCGEGRVPLVETLTLLDGAGYDGYIEFEWEKGWHPEIPAAEIAFPHFVEYMRRIRGN